MQISTRQSGGKVVLTIIADNASDRTILSLFDLMNSNGLSRRIVCGSTYDTKYSAVTELNLYGVDVHQPPSVFNRFRKWIGLKQ